MRNQTGPRLGKILPIPYGNKKDSENNKKHQDSTLDDNSLMKHRGKSVKAVNITIQTAFEKNKLREEAFSAQQ